MYDYTDKSQLKRYMAAENILMIVDSLPCQQNLGVVIFAVRNITSDNDSIKNATYPHTGCTVITDSGVTAYKDGSFIQHDNIPYIVMDARLYNELARCYIFFYRILKIKIKYNYNTWIEKSYLPFIYNGRAMDMVAWQRNHVIMSRVTCLYAHTFWQCLYYEMPEFNELKGYGSRHRLQIIFLNMLQYLRQNLRNIYKKIIILNRKKSSHILWHLTVWIELLNTEMVIR